MTQKNWIGTVFKMSLLDLKKHIFILLFGQLGKSFGENRQTCEWIDIKNEPGNPI